MLKGLFVTLNELTEIIKKRFEKEKNNGEEIDEDKITAEDINKFIIGCEIEKFCELFDKIFSSWKENILYIEEEEEEEDFDLGNFDLEDGAISDICQEIVLGVKKKLQEVDKLKILNLFFKLPKELFIKNDGED